MEGRKGGRERRRKVGYKWAAEGTVKMQEIKEVHHDCDWNFNKIF